MSKTVVVFTAAAALSGCVLGASESDLHNVTLTVENDTGTTLRCTAIFAHFVTRDLGRVRSGATMTVMLSRQASTGALTMETFRDQPMWLESIVCGLDRDWSATATDVPLDLLRSARTTQMHGICNVVDGLRCR